MHATVIENDTLRGIEAPRVITSEAQNERHIAALLTLGKKGRLKEKERGFAELLTLLIEAYEEECYPVRRASPVEMLQELLTANGLKQKDPASLLGSESVVSAVLSGKRELNRRHIERLSRRSHFSPAVFF
jgi:HTH-type transcriptional regulator/antitoxin HigA